MESFCISRASERDVVYVSIAEIHCMRMALRLVNYGENFPSHASKTTREVDVDTLI